MTSKTQKPARILVVAPHPDDESLGCGGTLLRHKAAGDEAHWLIATKMGVGYPAARKKARRAEIARISELYGFASVTELGFETTTLDAVPRVELVKKMAAVFKTIRPEIVYLPFPGDVHSDHRAVFSAAASCTKWFRHPSIRRVLAYEAPSETDFGIDPTEGGFQPNLFVDISSHLDRKIEILRTYSGELGEFPFPRSEKTVRSLAAVRGAAAGLQAAEAFAVLKERL
jgi:LmbE family N-acetylglucosaminyl deacetylase